MSYYKYSILLFIIIGGIFSGYYAYFKPSIYQASTILKIKLQEQGNYEDFLLVSSSQGSDIDDETVILESYPIAKRAVKKLKLGTRYFTYEKLKIKEFYKNSPFIVKYVEIKPFLYGDSFEILPIDDEYFQLIIKPKDSLIQKFKSYFEKKDKKFEFTHKYKYGELISTDYFTFTIIKKYDLKQQPYFFSIIPNDSMADFIKSGISASAMNKYGLILSLRFNDTVPQRAKDIVNSVAQAYIDIQLEEKSQGAKKQLSFIDMQLDAINKTLQGSSQKLQKYKAMNIVVNLSDKTRAISSKISELESKLFEVNSEMDSINTALNKIKNSKNHKQFDFILPKSINTVAPLVEQIRELLARYQTMSVNYTKEHPGVKKLAKEIIFLKKSLRQSLQLRYEHLIAESKRLKDIIDKYNNELKSIPKQEQQLEALSRHFMVNEKIYSYLLEKRAETAILAASTISNTKVVEWATTPYTPIKPKRKLIVLVGLILGLILGIVQALLRDMLDNKLHTQEDVENLTDLPIYASLPNRKKATKGLYSEAIRSLWINLSFVKSHSRAQIVSFTSTISGEGKTFTIRHLADTIVNTTDKKILLIDCDMRKPSLHKHYKLESNLKGLSNYLAQHCCIDDVIYTVNDSNLDILPGGIKAPNPTKLIFSDTFDDLIEEVVKRYDYILIDTSPVGLVADTIKIMRYSDIAMFLVRMNLSNKEYLTHIQKIQKQYSLDIGLVLNDLEFEKKSYYGYKYEYTDYYNKE
jgi:capsular exopolysaccharide synthesis family protein